MKALSFTIQKVWPLYNFLQTNKQTGHKLHAPHVSMQGHKTETHTHTNHLQVQMSRASATDLTTAADQISCSLNTNWTLYMQPGKRYTKCVHETLMSPKWPF